MKKHNKIVLCLTIITIATFLLSFGVFAQNSHLVVSLPLDGNLLDTTANHNDGIAYGYGTNDSMFVSDRFGVPHKALYLGGEVPQNWILIDTSASLNAAAEGNVTLTFWYKFANKRGLIFHMDYYDPMGGTRGYEFCPMAKTYPTGDTVIHFRTKGNSLTDLFHDAPIYLDTVWYFICGTIRDRGASYPDSNRFCYKLYVNGIEADSLYADINRPWYPMNPNQTILELGRNCNETNYANGTIDQVDIYNYEMTADEIDSLWLSSTTAPTLLHQPSGFVPTSKSTNASFKTSLKASGFCAEGGLHYAWYKLGDDSTILSTTDTLKGLSASDTTCRYYCKIMNKYDTTYSDSTPGNPANPCGIYTGIHYTSNLVEIFPNPTSGVFNVKFNFKIEEIEVMNLKGTIIFQENPNAKMFGVNLSGLSSGIYFMRIRTKNGSTTQRFIVSHDR